MFSILISKERKLFIFMFYAVICGFIGMVFNLLLHDLVNIEFENNNWSLLVSWLVLWPFLSIPIIWLPRSVQQMLMQETKKEDYQHDSSQPE